MGEAERSRAAWRRCRRLLLFAPGFPHERTREGVLDAHACVERTTGPSRSIPEVSERFVGAYFTGISQVWSTAPVVSLFMKSRHSGIYAASPAK